MARAGRISVTVDYKEVEQRLNASVRRVQRGTRKATVAACEEIKEISLSQVPRDSNTLAESFYYDIKGSYRNFEAEIGYGRGGGVNPRTGKTASEYMVAVHEDLSAEHPVGKAKFLEDAVKEYQRNMLARWAMEVRKEL